MYLFFFKGLRVTQYACLDSLLVVLKSYCDRRYLICFQLWASMAAVASDSSESNSSENPMMAPFRGQCLPSDFQWCMLFACVCSQIGTHVSNLCNATTMHNSMSLIQLTVLHLKVSKLLNICSTLIVECMHILAPVGSGAGTPIYSQCIVTF